RAADGFISIVDLLCSDLFADSPEWSFWSPPKVLTKLFRSPSLRPATMLMPLAIASARLDGFISTPETFLACMESAETLLSAIGTVIPYLENWCGYLGQVFTYLRFRMKCSKISR